MAAASERLRKSLADTLAAFTALEDEVEAELTGQSDVDDEQFSEAVVSGVVAALDGVLEGDKELTPRLVASALSALVDAVEEIEPGVFEGLGEEG